MKNKKYLNAQFYDGTYFLFSMIKLINTLDIVVIHIRCPVLTLMFKYYFKIIHNKNRKNQN